MSHRIERVGDAELHLADCRDVLPMLGRVDAVVTDPPYGTGCAPRGGKVAGTINLASAPVVSWDDFDLSWLKDIHEPVAVFCHHRSVGDVAGAIGADAVFAYVKSNPSPFGTSWEACVSRGFNRTSPQHITAYNAFNGQSHPTQKPIEVMEFVIGRAPGITILDPFMGSGTTGVACARLGRRFIGIECHEPYFNIAVKRITEAYKQADLFIQQPAPRATAEAWPTLPFGEPT